jgi:hypothetical protein
MGRTRHGLGTAAAAAVVGLVAAWVAWSRLGPVARGTVWAEDGEVFLRERLALGPVDTLLHPYAGYLHLVPRLVVDLALVPPVREYALVVSATCCLLTGAVCAGVFLLARDVVPSWPLRLLLAAVPVLLPTAPWEVSGNAANLHTSGLVLAPWLFAYRARSWEGAGALAGVAVLVGLTEVQAVFALPLLVLAWVPVRAGRAPAGRPERGHRLLALPVTVAALGAGAAQVVTALTTTRASTPGDPAAADVVAGWALQTVGGLWDADVAAVARAVVAHGWAVVAVPTVLVLGLVLLGVVVAVREGRWRAAAVAVVLVAGSAAVWTAALLANASGNGRWSQAAPAVLVTATPSRYAAAAGMLLTAAVLVAAAVLVDRPSRAGRSGRRAAVRASRPGGAPRVVLSAVGWCVVTVVVASWVGNLPGVAQRSTGPEWAPQVTRAEATCRVDRSAVVVVRTQPGSWTADVPCALVLDDR